MLQSLKDKRFKKVFTGVYIDKIKKENLIYKEKSLIFVTLYFKHFDGIFFNDFFDHDNLHSSVAGLFLVLGTNTKNAAVYRVGFLLNSYTGDRSFQTKIGLFYRNSIAENFMQDFLINKITKLMTFKWSFKKFSVDKRYRIIFKFMDIKYLYDETQGLGFSGWEAPLYLELILSKDFYFYINLFLNYIMKDAITKKYEINKNINVYS